MTHYQFGTMKHFINHDKQDIDKLGQFNLTTLGSLIKRGWLARSGFIISVTEEGLKAFEEYKYASANYRKVDTGLSDRVRDMLHLGIKLAKRA